MSSHVGKKPIQKWISLRDIPHEFVITMGAGVLPSDLELFFNTSPDKIDPQISLTHIKQFAETVSLEELVVSLDLFSSKGEARRNGWSGPIPEGYTEFTKKNQNGNFEWNKDSGEFKRMFFILNLPKSIKNED